MALPTLGAVAIVGAAFAYYMGEGNTETNYVEFQNQLISTSVFNVISQCTSLSQSTQFMSYECVGGGGTVFAENSGCTACLESHRQFELYRNEFEIAAAERNSNYTPKTISDLPASINEAWGIDKTCLFPCKDCIVSNVTQTSSLTLNVECEFDANFEANLKSQVKAAITDTIKNKQDVFGLLGSIFATNDSTLENDYANEVVSGFDATVKSQVMADIKTIQNIVIEDSRSIYVNNLSQTVHVNGIVSSLSKANFVNNITNKVDFDAALEQIKKNDTTGDLAASILKTVTGLADIFDSVCGKTVIMIVVILIGVVVIVVAAMAFQPDMTKTLLTVAKNKYINNK
jgi:hypothetical protein